MNRVTKKILGVHQHGLLNWMKQEVIPHIEHGPISEKYLEHMIGKDRVLGALFPFFFKYSDRDDDVSFIDFSRLFVAARSHVVVDDAMRDCDKTGLATQDLRRIKKALKELCRKQLILLTIDPIVSNRILENRLKQLEATYKSINSGAPPSYEIVFGRCATIGIAFDVVRLKWGKVIAETQERQAKYMLFAMQLADDYADLENDLKRPEERNLLYWKGTQPVLNGANELITKKQLRGRYTKIIMDVTAKGLEDMSGKNSPGWYWARALRNFLGNASETHIGGQINSMFRLKLPENYLPPTINPDFSISSIKRSRYHFRHSKNFRAEKIHASVSLDAVQSIR